MTAPLWRIWQSCCAGIETGADQLRPEPHGDVRRIRANATPGQEKSYADFPKNHTFDVDIVVNKRRALLSVSL